MQLIAHTFVRPGELRHAEWQDFDLDNAEWRIPAHKMKMKKPHIVPLSVQAVEILDKLNPLSGDKGYVFPSLKLISSASSGHINIVPNAVYTLKRLIDLTGATTGSNISIIFSQVLTPEEQKKKDKQDIEDFKKWVNEMNKGQE